MLAGQAVLDADTEPGRSYHYRLTTTGPGGDFVVLGAGWTNDLLLRAASRASISGQAVLEESSRLLATVNTDMAPELTSAVSQVEDTVASLRTMVDANSGTQREVTRLLVELTDATRSIRALTDYLERHPEALIRGKGE